MNANVKSHNSNFGDVSPTKKRHSFLICYFFRVRKRTGERGKLKLLRHRINNGAERRDEGGRGRRCACKLTTNGENVRALVGGRRCTRAAPDAGLIVRRMRRTPHTQRELNVDKLLLLLVPNPIEKSNRPTSREPRRCTRTHPARGERRRRQMRMRMHQQRSSEILRSY